MKKKINEIIEEYRDQLYKELGDSLESVILYGSRARGDAKGDADIDILCAMREPFDYGELIKRTSDATARISLKYGVTLSRTFVLNSDLKTREIPFLMNIKHEGVAV